jgi:hypothetical protein
MGRHWSMALLGHDMKDIDVRGGTKVRSVHHSTRESMILPQSSVIGQLATS